MSICRCASSRDELTDSHSPIAIEQAPAARPASPVNRIVFSAAFAPATPITRLRFETSPSFAPSTAARSAFPPSARWRPSSLASALPGSPRSPPGGAASIARTIAGVRPLGGRKPVRDRFGLIVVLADIALFERIDRRQNQLRPEAARQPSQCPRPPAQAEMLRADADAIELAAPEFGVPLLHRGESAIYLLEARIGFSLGEGSIQPGAVIFALQVCAIARGIVTLRHRSPAEPHTGSRSLHNRCRPRQSEPLPAVSRNGIPHGG